MIKNVIFDVGNVLVNFRPLEIMEELNFPREVIETLDNKMVLSPLWNELDLSIRPQEEIIEDMTNLVPEYKEYTRAFFNEVNNICVTLDYSKEWVKSFKDRGYNTFVLSNYSKEWWELHENLGVFPFLEHIDGKIVSGFVHKIKPDPEIYDILLKEFNLNPEESVFFDDRIDNIRAAEKLGIKGIHFKSREEADIEFNKLIKKG